MCSGLRMPQSAVWQQWRQRLTSHKGVRLVLAPCEDQFLTKAKALQMFRYHALKIVKVTIGRDADLQFGGRSLECDCLTFTKIYAARIGRERNGEAMAPMLAQLLKISIGVFGYYSGIRDVHGSTR